MNKRFYILLMIITLTGSVFGQFVGKDNLSISLFYMQKSEVDSAKKYIDLAVVDNDLKSEVKTWYWRGYIYKEIYKVKEKNNKTSPLRLTSIESFEKMLTLDGKEEFTQSTFKIFKYLASTLFNDASRLLEAKKYDLAKNNYKLFRSTMLLIDPNTDLKQRDIQFKLALAHKIRPSESEGAFDSTGVNEAKKLYYDVLLLEPNNPSANYNLATLFYNEGADIINQMDYDMDIEQANFLQDKCIDIFLKGLPFMKKAHELNYKREATLLGLSNIYLGLNDDEKSEAYKKELEDLENEK